MEVLFEIQKKPKITAILKTAFLVKPIDPSWLLDHLHKAEDFQPTSDEESALYTDILAAALCDRIRVRIYNLRESASLKLIVFGDNLFDSDRQALHEPAGVLVMF